MQSTLGRQIRNFLRQQPRPGQQTRQFPGHLPAVGFLHPTARNQQQMANLDGFPQQPEALPQQPARPVAFHGEQTVLFSAYHPAPQMVIRRRGIYDQHARTDQFLSVLPDLIEFGLESDLIRLAKRSFHCFDSCAGPAQQHPAEPEKNGCHAVRRARPFWRRRLMTRRPFLVAMRAKNPIRRLRRRFEG